MRQQLGMLTLRHSESTPQGDIFLCDPAMKKKAEAHADKTRMFRTFTVQVLLGVLARATPSP